MNSLLLLIDAKETWSPETWALENEGHRNAGGQVVMEDRSGWISIVRDPTVIDDYDDDDLTQLRSLIDSPVPYVIEWSGELKLPERVLLAVPTEVRAVVDNDHGLIKLLSDLVRFPLAAWVKAEKLR